MSLSAVVIILSDACALIFAFAAFANLMDNWVLPSTMKSEEIQVVTMRMIQACAELLMAFFIAAAGTALAGIILR